MCIHSSYMYYNCCLIIFYTHLKIDLEGRLLHEYLRSSLMFDSCISTFSGRKCNFLLDKQKKSLLLITKHCRLFI